MGDVYEVAFIREASVKDGQLHYCVHWAGCTAEDEMDEPATSCMAHGESLNVFWLSFSPEEIFKALKEGSVSLKPELTSTVKADARKHKATQNYNPGPLPPLRPSSGTEGEPIELQYSNSILIVDPKLLWLPPDRLGQPVNNPKLLFDIVVNALESEGIRGHEFYQHLKKDRKEFGQKWFEKQCCVICMSGDIETVLTCPTRAVGYCGPCTVQLLKASRQSFPSGPLTCPCCRQKGYLISKEWVFAQNEEARHEYKKQYKTQKNRKQKGRAKEVKLARRQQEDGDIEEGEILE
ncbi:hypothetical protein BT96DRAFT_1004304 [Gymnopus androsaceus JB14]|uniref:Chromo domain-containing protein n=1 Tax=Gymnopus androsaceus JB14 TaxID=1447944 RepID=A0A6A4GRP5_9AGAR|nr:hypothetical protein BT96DRAFT_1004304 [Gymnopus androsaceus JB14]